LATYIYPPVSISGGDATAANQALMITELEAINTDTDTLVAVDYATETTLALVATEATAAAILVDTTSLDGKDFSTEVTSAAILADTTSLDGKDFSTEVTSAAILVDTSVIAGDTTSIDGKITACNTGAVVVSSSALPTGAATSANQATIIANQAAITPVDFLDSGVVDSSSTNIPAAGLTVVASLAADCTELEVVDDIGEYMTLTDGSNVVLAYLALGGGRVKVSISSGTELKLASVSGSTISAGKIAINILG